ncbi:MAG: tRNA modification GTPase [Sedimentisphaeraceae bacterium JB056]
MYESSDTITAVSSGSANGLRHIIRLSGNEAANALSIFSPCINASERGIINGRLDIMRMSFDAIAYVFPKGQSYTGDELIELHVECPLCITEKILEKLCENNNVRLAEAGEFTARAFFNGKLDLTQAEAVAQIVSGSNAFQLQAAQKLLKGRLSEKISNLRRQILELLSLLEAGLDFSEEDITFITESQAAKRVEQITSGLRELITNNIKYERMIGLPAIAITGCPNAGKSSLMNAMLGKERSIVSSVRATTRDVISEVFEFDRFSCILSDCAGIIKDNAIDEIDAIAQNSAMETIKSSDMVIFCVDITKTDFTDEQTLFECFSNNTIALATKSDKLTENELQKRIAKLESIFNIKFTPICTSKNDDVIVFIKMLENELALLCGSSKGSEEVIAVNRRHYQTLEKVLANVSDGLKEVKNGNDELTAMYLRSSYMELSDLNEQQSIDESILDTIFSNFCIGK